MYKPLFPRSGRSNRNPVDQKVSGGRGETDGTGMEKKEDVSEGCRVLPRESGMGGEGWGHCEEALASLA